MVISVIGRRCAYIRVEARYYREERHRKASGLLWPDASSATIRDSSARRLNELGLTKCGSTVVIRFKRILAFYFY